MGDFIKLKDLFSKLNFILSRRQKHIIIGVFAMSIVAAALELLGVSIILPVMDMLLNPEEIMSKWYMKPFTHWHILQTDLGIIWFVCAVAIVVYILKNLFFIFYSWVSTKCAYKIQRELAVRVLKTYMKQGYLFFVNNNSARLLQGLGADISSVYSIINALFLVANKMLTILCISIFIMFQSLDLAISLVILLVVCFALIQVIYRNSMRKNGIIRRKYQQQCALVSIQAIQGNKEILVNNKQQYFVNKFEEMQKKVNNVATKVDMGTVSPAYIIEMFCVCGLLSIVGIKMTGNVNSAELIAKLSAVAVAAFRVLPALGGVSSGINSITMNTSQLAAAYQTLYQIKDLEKRETEANYGKGLSKNEPVPFLNKIEISNLAFAYPGSENVLTNLNMVIQKGKSIALIGASGAGKTTLADIILGLLKPNAGSIKMDGVDIQLLGSKWNDVIGYVSQTIYMLDDTIRRNVAFGILDNEIDDERIWKVLKIAQLDVFVKSLPEGLDTMTGEHGIRFSGGQRQRIAIARAMYNDPEILVLDEATAALDGDTENAVMEAIDALHGEKTMIIVAHRLTTIRNCDHVYEVGNGVAIERCKEEILRKEGILL